MKNSEFFTTGEVATLCGVTLRTVINWIQRGHLVAHKLPGTRGDNRITKHDLKTFMLQNSMPIPDFLTDGNKSHPINNDLVLVVDDDVSMAKSIMRIIRQSGRECLVARNGFEAGVLYAEHKPGIMTLDLQIPKMDGFEVLESLKTRKSGKILVISAMQDHQLQKALALGADAILKKPFEVEELLQALSTLAQEAH